MKISPESEMGQEIISRSSAWFKGMKGAIINFQRLCLILKVDDKAEAAPIVELLCRKDVSVLKHVYFFLDETDNPILLKDVSVYEFLKTGNLYNPISNDLVDPDTAYASVVIEFEVLQ